MSEMDREIELLRLGAEEGRRAYQAELDDVRQTLRHALKKSERGDHADIVTYITYLQRELAEYGQDVIKLTDKLQLLAESTGGGVPGADEATARRAAQLCNRRQLHQDVDAWNASTNRDPSTQERFVEVLLERYGCWTDDYLLRLIQERAHRARIRSGNTSE